MDEDILIQKATVEDADAVAGLAAALLAELSGAAAADPASYQGTATELLAKQSIWAFLAIAGSGPPVGLLTLYEASTVYARGRFGVIAELYVTPDRRSGGIAKNLVEAAMVFAKEKGWNRLEVTAPPRPRWQRTINFYLNNNFSEGGPRLQCFVSE